MDIILLMGTMGIIFGGVIIILDYFGTKKEKLDKKI